MIRLPHHSAFGVQAFRVWFADHPPRRDSLSLTIYHAAADVGPLAGFSRTPGHTLLIDLRKTEADLLRSYGNSTSDQIKRARREGLTVRLSSAVEDFVPTFNTFARSRGLGTLRTTTLKGYGEACMASEIAESTGRVLSRHLLLIDHASGRVRMYKGCPATTPTDAEDRKLIGRANRYLHHSELVHFSALGFAVYDMGGYALDTTDRVLQGINRFKIGFGGEVVREALYRPLPMALWDRLSSLRRPDAKAANTAAQPATPVSSRP